MTPTNARAGKAAAAETPPVANANWSGAFSGEFLVPNETSAVTSSVEYRLTLADDKCDLVMQGLQTDEAIRCAAKANDNAVAISFVSYADGTIVNKYGVAQYKEGEALFTLTRAGDGLTTRWQSLSPHEEAGVEERFFVRQN